MLGCAPRILCARMERQAVSTEIVSTQRRFPTVRFRPIAAVRLGVPCDDESISYAVLAMGHAIYTDGCPSRPAVVSAWPATISLMADKRRQSQRFSGMVADWAKISVNGMAQLKALSPISP